MSSKFVPGSLEEAEANAVTELRARIGRHLSWLKSIYNVLVRMTAMLDERKLSEAQDEAALLLIARIANDIRAIDYLSGLGYGAQACSLAATVFEAAYTFAHVARDHEAAGQWISHGDIRRTPINVKRLIKLFADSVVTIPRAKVNIWVDREYLIYTDLCGFKHANPVGLFFVKTTEEGYVTSRMGPDLTEFGQASICLAIERSGRLAMLVASVMVDHILPSIDGQCLIPTLDALHAELEQLDAESRRRWHSNSYFQC